MGVRRAERFISAASEPETEEQERFIQMPIRFPPTSLAPTDRAKFVNVEVSSIGRRLGRTRRRSGFGQIHLLELALHIGGGNIQQVLLGLEETGASTPFALRDSRPRRKYSHSVEHRDLSLACGVDRDFLRCIGSGSPITKRSFRVEARITRIPEPGRARPDRSALTAQCRVFLINVVVAAH
jgi:hypothetical protein